MELSTIDNERYEKLLIAHACGLYNGLVYTNSLEAFKKNYNEGYRRFEIDLLLTKKGNVMAFHNPLGYNFVPSEKFGKISMQYLLTCINIFCVLWYNSCKVINVLRYFEVLQKTKELEYIIIGGVPVLGKNDYKIVHPKLNNLIIEQEKNKEYIIIKKYKKRFKLSPEFFNDKYLPNLYWENFENLFLNSSNKVFMLTNEYIDINETTNLDDLLNSNITLNLKKFYKYDLIYSLLSEILNKTLQQYNKYEDYEDYDYRECMMIVMDKFLDEYYKDISKNIEKIYIIQSIIYYDFHKLYYELYCYTKNH